MGKLAAAIIERVRWNIFVWMSAVGWRICAEPHRSQLQGVMPPWDEISRKLKKPTP